MNKKCVNLLHSADDEMCRIIKTYDYKLRILIRCKMCLLRMVTVLNSVLEF